MSKPNTTEVDYEIVQAAFAMLATLDMLEDDGVFERLRVREHHFHEQDGRCIFCRCSMKTDDHPEEWDLQVTLEHLVRDRSRPDFETVSTTAAACKACNHARGDMPLEEFMANVHELRADYVTRTNNRAARRRHREWALAA